VCVPVGWGVDGQAVGQKRLIPSGGNLVGGYLNPATYKMSQPFRMRNNTTQCLQLEVPTRDCEIP
jgi:hypothetical protein